MKRCFVLILSIVILLMPPLLSSANWYDNLIFNNQNFTFELIRILGQTPYGGADIGEVLSTARTIKDEDIHGWYQQWLKTADRIYHIAETSAKNGNIVSARAAYFRAASYYRAAGFYMDAKIDRDKSIATWKMSRISFLKAIASLPYIKMVKIPYQKTYLDGYLINSFKQKAPLLIVHTGFDGTMEELYYTVAVAAHERGFNVLLFEGPGQGGALREKNLYFIPNWEKAVTAVIDYAYTLPNIDKNKIALMGISMGGYLAPRACAFEHRINACIANEGTYDFGVSVYQKLPAEIIKYIDTNPQTFNKILTTTMQKSVFINWFFNHGMWAFNVSSPAEFMRKVREYSLKGIAKKIQCPTLIISRKADDALKTDSKKLYDAIKAPKTYYVFTPRQAAQAHTQAGAQMLSNQVILDWLSKIFDLNNANHG